jgi:hypothetical protein
MSRVLNIILGLASSWVIFLGIYNIAAHRGGSTGELQQAQLWIGIMALSIAIGLLAIFFQLIRK